MARILLAEDSPTQAILLRSLIEEDAHEVRVAADGAAAFDLVKDDAPDIVVTDMQMPKMNGLELVQKLREGFPHIPVILITAQGSEELSAIALKEGAAAYLPKSLVDEELLRTIEKVLVLMAKDISYKNLIECLDYYEFQFTLENDPDLIPPLVNLLQQVASGMQFCDDVTQVRIGTALEQAVRNAMIRGNLEVSHDDQLKDEEFAVKGEPTALDERRADPALAERRVHLQARLGRDQFLFVVRDDGNGFDTSSISWDEDPHLSDRDGGRGLVLIKSFMDEVRFNDAGNEITMIKHAIPQSERELEAQSVERD